MKKIAILQSNYIPWKGYFDLINSVDTFVFYDSVQYTKNDWRNRNQIKNQNGLQWLTIPVVQNSLQQKISETKIFNRQWLRKHIQAIEINYKKSPYFNEVFPFIIELYDFDTEFLSEINRTIIEKICIKLNINTEFVSADDLNLVGNKTDKLIDACKKLNASVYVSGPKAKNYIDNRLFDSENIILDWIDYDAYDLHNQIHPPLQHNVSIIDTLFNLGLKNTEIYIKNKCKF